MNPDLASLNWKLVEGGKDAGNVALCVLDVVDLHTLEDPGPDEIVR